MIEPRPAMKAPNIGDLISPTDAMRWALLVARNGAGFVLPNPMVGCVIVDPDHKFLAAGWHKKVGQAHAEIDALEQLAIIKGSKEAVAGCHVYVTLEPCAHEGRTGSCAKALAALKPASVTYALVDPNPLVAGKGGEILKQAGVIVNLITDQELIDEAEDVNDVFLWSMRNKGPGAKPFVTVKVASSLDGRVAMRSGESKWITSELAREKGQRLRLEHDAIIVGRGTIEADNPSMNVRLPDVQGHVNSIVVVDPKGKIADRLHEFEIAKVRPPTRVFVCIQAGLVDAGVVARAKEKGFRVFEVGGPQPGVIDLDEMLVKLREFGMNGVYVEGGPGTVGPFLDKNLAQRLHVFMATKVLGGKHGVGWTDLCGGETLKDGWQLGRQRVKMIGQDLHITGRLDIPAKNS